MTGVAKESIHGQPEAEPTVAGEGAESARGVLRGAISPVTEWATLGTVFIVFAAYLWTRWIASGNAATTPSGSTPMPTWMLAAVWVFEVAVVLGGLATTYFFVVRPWRRERRLSFDGLFFLAAGTMLWQDNLSAYKSPMFLYNTHFLQFGSWFRFVPGWGYPHGGMIAEPLILVASYVSDMGLVVVMLNGAMRRLGQRWPPMGPGGTIASAYLLSTVVYSILTFVPARVGLFVYPGASGWFTLFDHRYYRIPLYETFSFPLVWTSMAAVRFFRNDKGQTIVERGIERIRTSERKRTVLRFLALAGVWNVAFLGLYNLPMGLAATRASWPADIVNRPYFTNGLCGPGTAYTCPAPSHRGRIEPRTP